MALTTKPEFNPWNPQSGGREPTPVTFPLTSTHAPQHMYPYTYNIKTIFPDLFYYFMFMSALLDHICVHFICVWCPERSKDGKSSGIGLTTVVSHKPDPLQKNKCSWLLSPRSDPNLCNNTLHFSHMPLISFLIHKPRMRPVWKPHCASNMWSRTVL